MTTLSIQPPFPLITDIDGQPLEDGYIWIGVANLPPIGNPVSVYWDAALTQPAALPVRTRGGYPVNNGTPARLYVGSDYSILVQNKNGSVIYSAPAATERYSGVVVEISSTDVSFLQAGTGAVTRTAQSKMREVVSVKDFGAVGDGVTSDTAAIQAAIDSVAGPVCVLLPAGTYKTTSTIFLRRNGVRLVGQGPAVTKVQFVNASGGIVFSGDTNTFNSTAQYEGCALEDFEVLSSGSAATDASIVVDLSPFSYGHFNIEAQTRRVGGVIYYGQGNAGVAPYYNHIESTGLFGGADYTQTAFQFRGGAFLGGSNGPNANIIGPITRAASLDTLADIRVGQANLFSNISGESIGGAYFILGGNASVSSGTSTGSNTENTFKDTSKTWTTNAYINGAVQISAGTGQGQVRTIRINNANTLTIYDSWATIPDATSQYSIYEGKALKNKFVNTRAEGLDSLNPDFIYAHPAANYNEFSQMSVESLGSGRQVVDFSGCPANVLYGSNKFTYTHVFTTPGASANLNAFPRLSVWGGLPVAGDYVIEWLRVNVDYFSHGDTATVTLDAGGNAVGAGVQTLIVGVTDNNSQGMALPLGTQKLVRSGTNSPIFLNLQTGAAFSAGRSVIVTFCLTLV